MPHMAHHSRKTSNQMLFDEQGVISKFSNAKTTEVICFVTET
jgi:hypothetical protein